MCEAKSLYRCFSSVQGSRQASSHRIAASRRNFAPSRPEAACQLHPNPHRCFRLDDTRSLLLCPRQTSGLQLPLGLAAVRSTASLLPRWVCFIKPPQRPPIRHSPLLGKRPLPFIIIHPTILASTLLPLPPPPHPPPPPPPPPAGLPASRRRIQVLPLHPHPPLHEPSVQSIHHDASSLRLHCLF